METNHYLPLTASEISTLWGVYQKNSLFVRVITYFLEKVEDVDIRDVLQLVKKQGQDALAMVEEVCQREQMAIPVGFTDEDVNPSAPRLFSDAFMLEYARQLEVATIATASAAIPNVTRSDVTNICQKGVEWSLKHHDIAKKTLIAKGQYSRPPAIPTPKQVDFVEKQKFLRGFLGEKRPLSALEITHLFMNMQTNALGKALMMGFAQVAKDAQVTKYLVRGKEIAHKHVEIFRSRLSEENLPASRAWDDNVMTANTESPFSDKLMTFHTTALVDIGIGNYGFSTAGSPRRDVGLMYARLMAEIAAMAEDGGELMISNAWLEQPPPAPDGKHWRKGGADRQLIRPPLLRILNHRMKLPDPQRLLNVEQGFAGERTMDAWLEDLSADCLVINDLLLEQNRNLFQIDTLVIFQEKVYILDAKHNAGDFYIDDDNWRTVSGTEIENPQLQMKRRTTLLRKLLQKLRMNFPIDSILIFTHPEFYLYNDAPDLPAVFPTQMPRFFKKMNRQTSRIGQKHEKLAEQLLALHKLDNPHTHWPDYDYDRLKKGVVCSACGSFMHYRRKSVFCAGCGTAEDTETAVMRSIAEYRFMFPGSKDYNKCDL